MSSVSNKIDKFEKLSEQAQAEKKAEQEALSQQRTRRTASSEKQPQSRHIDTNRLLQRLQTTPQQQQRTTVVGASSPSTSTTNNNNKSLLVPSPTSSRASVTTSARLAARGSGLLKHDRLASAASKKNAALSAKDAFSAKRNEILGQIEVGGNRKKSSPSSSPSRDKNEEQEGDNYYPQHPAGVSSTTFSENRVSDKSTGKILILGSQSSEKSKTLKRQQHVEGNTSNMQHPSPVVSRHHNQLSSSAASSASRSSALYFGSRQRTTARRSANRDRSLPGGVTTIIPRWATPSPGSSQIYNNNNNDQQQQQLSHDEDSPPPVGGINNNKSVEEEEENRRREREEELASILADESVDPCPPEMLMEMMLHSVVIPQNEIKMKRQVALWECYERKMNTGSFLDVPYATEC